MANRKSVRAQEWGRPGAFIPVEVGATEGATLGVNLRLQDGRVLALEEVLNSAAPRSPAQAVFWELIREIPRNLAEIAKLDGAGFPYRGADGAWRTRKVGREVVAFSFGDASPAPIYITPHALFVVSVRVVVDVAFDGEGAELSVGSAAYPALLQGPDGNLPQEAGSYETGCTVAMLANEQIYLTIVPGAGATAGAGRIILDTIPLEGI